MQISERQMLKTSAIGTVVGLVLLYFISVSIEVEAIGIGKIDNGFVGKFVNITGTAEGVKKSDSGMFFNLVNGEKKIKVVLWNNILEQLELKGVDTKDITDGKKINLVGIVELYRGSLEVIPTKAQVKIV